jgi:putative transposase
VSRPLRVAFPGALYHVTSRGHERGAIFRDSLDRREFLSVLASVIDEQTWLLHAYCLMGNHYHLLVETTRPTLSRGMHSVNARHSQRFNKRHQRAGHVLEGRFKAIVVQREPHFLELHRYIVLNPVRAGIVRRAKDWPWSNYRATSGAVVAPRWLEVAATLALFSAFGSGATGAYERFVAEGLLRRGSPLDAVRGQIYLGDRRFLEKISGEVRRQPHDREIPATQRDPVAFDIEEICLRVSREWGIPAEELRGRDAGDAKLAAVYLCRKLCGKSAREIGDAFGIGRGRVGNIMTELQRRRRSYLRVRVERLASHLRASRSSKSGLMWQVET